MDDDDRAEEAALDGAHMSKIKTLSALRSLSSSSGFYMFSLRKPVEEESDLSALKDPSFTTPNESTLGTEETANIDFYSWKY